MEAKIIIGGVSLGVITFLIALGLLFLFLINFFFDGRPEVNRAVVSNYLLPLILIALLIVLILTGGPK